MVVPAKWCDYVGSQFKVVLARRGNKNVIKITFSSTTERKRKISHKKKRVGERQSFRESVRKRGQKKIIARDRQREKEREKERKGKHEPAKTVVQ